MSTPAKLTNEQQREFVLASLRAARARVSLMVLELDEIGLALKHNMITPDFAVGWVDHIGATPLINPLAKAEETA